MAGVSTNLLYVDYKKADRLAFAPPLKEYIAQSYAEDPDVYIDDFRNLEGLRGDVVAPDTHVASLNKLLRYYGQLMHLSSKFPMDENHIKICFCWYNAFGKDKDRKSVSSYNVKFEIASIIFDIGAMYSQLAVAENRGTGDGLKRASIYFQQAAGAFKHIQDSALEWGLPSATDLQAPTLTALTNLMLAQAQECFWYKAVVDKMKDAVIARLAAQAAEYYDVAHQSAVGASGTFTDAWAGQMQIKANHFRAAAQYRKALDCQGTAKYGEGVARLQYALGFIKKAMEGSSFKKATQYVQADLKNLQQTLQAALASAEKDNDTVYMEPVTRTEALQPIGAANMVTPHSFPAPSQITDIVGPPLFAKLVPFSVHQSVSVYTHKKEALVNSLVTKLTEATAVAQSTLASMNLPAAIEALEQPIGLPKTVIEHSEEVRQQGGAQSLHDTWATITALAEKDNGILVEAIRTLDEESAEDENMRAQFGPRWTGPRSAELTPNLRESAKVYRQKLDTAKKSDLLIKAKLEKNLHFIESLGLTKPELEASIPSSTQSSTLVTRDPNVKQLKQLLDQLNKNIKRRAPLVAEIKTAAAADDIAPKLVDAANRKEGAGDDEGLFAEQLGRYEAFEGTVRELVEEQELVLHEIRETNDLFHASHQTTTLIREREQALQNLDNAYKAFREISQNMAEGLKFYTDFQSVLLRFQSNCRDFASARSVDKRDQVGGLMRTAAGIGGGGSATGGPALPPRHAGQGQQGGGYYQQQQPPQGQGQGQEGYAQPGVWTPNQAPSYSSTPYGQQPPPPHQQPPQQYQHQNQPQQQQQPNPFSPNVAYSSQPLTSMPPPMNAQGQSGSGGYRPYGA
ncbi:BRO1-like domain-containing protein [Fimicolochytrium jonesii]|uniref:BRO1-like domain-containing protein n=1 Tax=Fimicolochytrium jonesii TaxID=1396493 RepID=UPI0022FEA76E|nr:BRO1-like domain-containing protein [Fimicolochytrium jonesii]KAI8817046.1 BRO1-like domain-containing protein [Fimicolochytrium jonesii]